MSCASEGQWTRPVASWRRRQTSAVAGGGDGGNDDWLSGNVGALWHDIGDKTVRETASKCLREHNGVANKAIAALVKTVTANSDACPVNYATLMKKAVVEYKPMTLPQQQQQGGGGQYPPSSSTNNNNYEEGGVAAAVMTSTMTRTNAWGCQRAYLAMGPNLGNRHRNVADALVALASHSNV
jgi:hypothetical protein